MSQIKLGDIEQAAGNLDAARTRYADSLAIAENLAAADPGNAGRQRDLSVSHNKLGDVEQAAGNLDAARIHYAADLAIAEWLASADSGNAEWQRDVWVSLWKLAGLPGSVIRWHDVVARMEGMGARGTLLQPDRPFLERARANAACEAEE